MQSWYNNGGRSDLLALESAMTGIVAPAQAGDFTATAQACSTLSTAVANMEAAGPMPYHPAEKWFARALSKFDESAAECQAGASTQNVSALAQALSEEDAGLADLTKATKAINRLDNSLP
jgi:hypothetical protein